MKTKKQTKTKGKKGIKKEMGLNELIQKHPEAIEVLFSRGMGCVGCSASYGETLEQGCMAHGIDAEDLVKEINKKLDKKKKGAKK